MKKNLLKFFIYGFFYVIFIFPLFFAVFSQEKDNQQNKIIPRAYVCPPELEEIYKQKNTGEKCTTSYEEFMSNPNLYHYWTDDEKVTIEGRAKERARQFIFWVMNHPSIDNHPVLIKIWSTARNISYFFVILIAALLGLAIIIGQRTNFDTGIKIWPSVVKIFTSILYISFSATIVILLIQLSDIFMKFFTENLGGKDLFNIYFKGVSEESNYNFYGIRDLNVGAQEVVRNQLFVLKLTEITYYALGGVLILRKVILWFLLFVSPFLPILLSFTITKNIGIVWIGVFFQWLFYGPLLSLFLGGMATIWKAGIPFVFDFSRSGSAIGYVYPTATNILWGGPAQKLTILNNVNYIDPYAEYLITLIMLWAVIFFPWWLLRTFRDYCCDGISAIKNILLSNLSSGKAPSPQPSLIPSELKQTISDSIKLQREINTSIKTKIETIEEIKKAKTEEIVSHLDLKANNLTDIAKFETNKDSIKNINYLKNPTQAKTATERQKFMNLKVEIANRAAKSDLLARRIYSSVFSSPFQQIKNRSNIITTLPKTTSTTQIISFKVKLPTNKVQNVTSSIVNYISSTPEIISTISQKTNISQEKIQQLFNLLNQNIDQPPQKIISKITEETKLEKQQISLIIKEYFSIVKSDEKTLEKIASETDTKPEEVKTVIEEQTPLISEPEKNIEQTIVIPQTVSIDEYEQVKKMWLNQYEKGEIPTTENIKTREQWIENDILVITNTLNKLYSENEEMKNQGLDDVNYILPIFMINNLNGEQLVTYLKAKLEAAKTVKLLLDKEKEITEKLKSQTEKVEIFIPKKKEAAKEMRLEEEIKN